MIKRWRCMNMMDTQRLDSWKLGTCEVYFKWDFGMGMFTVIIITFLGQYSIWHLNFDVMSLW